MLINLVTKSWIGTGICRNKRGILNPILILRIAKRHENASFLRTQTRATVTATARACLYPAPALSAPWRTRQESSSRAPATPAAPARQEPQPSPTAPAWPPAPAGPPSSGPVHSPAPAAPTPSSISPSWWGAPHSSPPALPVSPSCSSCSDLCRTGQHRTGS